MNKYVYLLKTDLKSLFVIIKLRLFGYSYLFNFKGLKYYIFKCDKHGSVINYKSGWDDTVQCPMCLNECIKESRKHK